MNTPSVPRGIRNCNPGNIRKTGTKWQGLRPIQNDVSFLQFVSMEYGYRAMAKTLLTYYRKYKLDTVSKVINRWAPITENNTASYVKHVAEKLGVQPGDKINVTDAKILEGLCTAITLHENGIAAKQEEVKKGVQMALQ